MSPGQRPSKTNYCCAFIALVLLSIAVFDDDLPFMTVSDDKVYHWTINDQNVNVSVEMHYNLRDVVQCRTFRGDSGINVRNPSLPLSLSLSGINVRNGLNECINVYISANFTDGEHVCRALVC